MRVILATVILLASGYVHAGSCILKIDRKACPGQEASALKPYNGKNPTEEKSEATSAADCEKTAEKASKIVRKKSLSEKSVSGTFDGAALSKTYSDKSDCK